MSARISFLSIFIVSFLAMACGDNKTQQTTGNTSPSATVTSENIQLPDTPVVFDHNRPVDLNQDLSKKSLQELRLLWNELFAKQGYCFMQADLRGYFTYYMTGYDSLMNTRFDAEENPDIKTKYPPIQLTKEQQEFVKKIEALEAEKKKNNYSDRNGVQLANVGNIVNLFQYKGLSKEFAAQLNRNNFVIVPGNNTQLFQVYEENDYRQTPNFITTDLYLQLYHMYFMYTLRSLEESKFIPIITDLSEGMYNEAMAKSSSGDAEVKAAAEFTATFYAIPYYILTGKKKAIPARYKAAFESELAHIASAQDDQSKLLETTTYFGYSLFRPRGHYTRSEELKKYFKAMMWLQTASFCRETPAQLGRTIFMACLLNSGRNGDKTLISLYNSVYEPIVYLIGEPDNLSVNDIVTCLKQNRTTDPAAAMKPGIAGKVDAYLKETVKGRNKIKPKAAESCPDKINFMPQRYLFDNEIIQELVDVHPNANRAYPKGLDIFASLGNKTAEDILMKEEKDGEQWSGYATELGKLKSKFSNYNDWNKTVYNKWISCLNKMQEKNTAYPGFMQTNMWDRKNLNTSLASWAELKHDAILYGEQPMGAECGGGGPPPPYVVGYVEPNVNFWKAMIEMLQLTEDALKKNGVLTDDLAEKNKQIKETTQFLLSASEKELKRQKLTEEEYRVIQALGASTEFLTLSLLEPGKSLTSWQDVNGPDKAVAVVADVYTRNINGCNKNGILHVATGNVNYIYVVVEIEGYLYLSKGATFSYYEFVQPLDKRLTDEEWQEMLDKKKNLPALPKWMKDIMLQSKDVPGSDEKVFYSAGC